MTAPNHRFRFARAGGNDQVLLSSREDLEHLDQLDLTLWAALAMPTRGVCLDSRTLALLDSDGDGRILAPDILAAVRWCVEVLVDSSDILGGGDRLQLRALRDGPILAGARRILSSLGKDQAEAIELSDLADTKKIFVSARFNGDGVVTPDAAEDEATREAIENILAIMPPVMDRSGQPGVDRVTVGAFFSEARALHAWRERVRQTPALRPLGEATEAACALVEQLRTKVDEYFARCALGAYSPASAQAFEEAERLACAASANLSRLPLSTPAPRRALPLAAGVHPDWKGPLAALAQALCSRDEKPVEELTELEWIQLSESLAPTRAWVAEQPKTSVEKLDAARIEELATGAFEKTILELVERDAQLETEYAQISAVEKLLLFHRDLGRVLRSFVNLADFYRGAGALFQMGRLYLDGRCCELCIEASDPGKHALLSAMASTYLAYCDCTRPNGARMCIAAAFTDGDSDNLFVGRNGVFYDHQGQPWDATIVRTVSHPISIRQALWAPYKKLARLVQEQLMRRAAAAEEASSAELAGAAASATSMDKSKRPESSKIDVGTVAAIGVAIGGIGAMVTGVLAAFLGLGIWMPLGFLLALVLISGPSVLLAYLKLRQRNLGPLLDASGWAVNGRGRVNIPFGASLTRMATLPKGAERSLRDPYAEKRAPWRTYLALGLFIVGVALWYLGKLDAGLPRFAKSTSVLGEDAPAYQTPESRAPKAPMVSPSK
jgi:hypothetical protein